MMGQLTVQKYGGSSLASTDRIKSVARNIEEYWKKNKRVVVVVSAMGDTTNTLLNLAFDISARPSSREVDMLLTAGERISMALLSMALEKLGVPCQSLTGSQSGILTTAEHGNAQIVEITGKRILDGLSQNHVMIIAGFQGVCPNTREVTTLGRGGSDLSAVALAASLSAEVCEIYTDVSGIYTSDPRKIKEAIPHPHLTWDVALNIAWAGAKVLHHRAAYLAWKKKVPLRVLSSFDPHLPGTRIEGTIESMIESACILSIVCRENLSFVRLEIRKKTASSDIFSWLTKKDISPDYFSTQSSESNPSIDFSINNDGLEELQDFLDLPNNESINLTVKSKGLVGVSIVGRGFRQDSIALIKINEIMGEIEIFSSIKDDLVYCLVPEELLTYEVLHQLHQLALESLN